MVTENPTRWACSLNRTSFQWWSPELKHASGSNSHPRKWWRSQKQHHPHTASQNNETPFRSYLLQPAETPNLCTELPFLTQRKHPCISDGCICFDNLPQAKCHCRINSVLIMLKKVIEKWTLVRCKKVLVTWLHVAVLQRRTPRRSSILITPWRICTSW